MSYVETRAAAARRRIAAGARIIARQRALIDKLKSAGRSTKGAEQLLQTMLETQRLLERQIPLLVRQDRRDGHT